MKVKTARLKHDAYMTPPHYIAALLAEVNIWGSVFEPCVGDGAIANELRRLPAVQGIDTNDIDPNRGADYGFDASEPWPMSTSWDWVVTNPPFSQALPILEQALTYNRVAMLLRLSFLEPTEERAWLLESNPPTRLIVLPRYSFRPPSTDNVTCAWAVWGGGCHPGISVWSKARCEASLAMRGL